MRFDECAHAMLIDAVILVHESSPSLLVEKLQHGGQQSRLSNEPRNGLSTLRAFEVVEFVHTQMRKASDMSVLDIFAHVDLRMAECLCPQRGHDHRIGPLNGEAKAGEL